jgi:ABC-type sugar transport system ATPase subunit
MVDRTTARETGAVQAEPAPPYLLEAEGISKQFPGVKALDGIHLRLRPGSVHALMGENGAGKSTLMKIIAGMMPPTTGEIRVGG